MRDVIKCVGWENCHVNCVGSYRPLVLLICWWDSEEEFTIDLNVIHCKCSNSESLLKVMPGFMCSHVACWRISKTRLSWTRVKLTFANTPTHLAKALSSFPFSSLLGYAGDVQYIPPSSSSEAPKSHHKPLCTWLSSRVCGTGQQLRSVAPPRPSTQHAATVFCFDLIERPLVAEVTYCTLKETDAVW